MLHSSLHFNPTAILMSSNHPCSAPFWLLFLVDRNLELLFVTAHSHTYTPSRHFTTPSTEINKSIAVSTFEGKIDESYDWLDFQLEIFLEKLVRAVFIAYWHVEGAFSPLFTAPDTPRSVNFFLDFHIKKPDQNFLQQ